MMQPNRQRFVDAVSVERVEIRRTDHGIWIPATIRVRKNVKAPDPTQLNLIRV
jgi:hypothetical protein